MARGILEIDGRRIELTDAQVEELLKGKEESYFNRRKSNQRYYSISHQGKIVEEYEHETVIDLNLYNVANYCANKELMQQRALHEILDRLLWRFSMENDGDKIDWGNNYQSKYRIVFNCQNYNFVIESNQYIKNDRNYFYSRKTAERAIEEIIKPFMKEHPDFVW